MHLVVCRAPCIFHTHEAFHHFVHGELSKTLQACEDSMIVARQLGMIILGPEAQQSEQYMPKVIKLMTS